MFIKTVSTTSGINPIKFVETGGVFYWILNTGSSTIYASTKATFTAGDDGVVSLGPKESRRLETNNDTIYILGEGQVEIHNQRDGICSFKQAPTSSGGGGTIDAYTKTESDAKYAQKTDIPTSLPANGGNADTVDGYHIDNLIHVSESIPPEYITEFLRINEDTKSIERWNTGNLKVAFANNADTLDGLHADDFAKYDNPSIEGAISLVRTGNATTAGSVFAWEDTLRLRNQDPNAENITYTDLLLTPSGIFTEGVSNGNYISRKEISTTPIKSTGWITSPTDQYGTIILPNGDTRSYLSIAVEGCYVEMFLANGKYTIHIMNGNYEKIINTPISYNAFYIE